MVPIGTSHLWWLRLRTHLSSASFHLSLLVGARGGIVEVFCLHIIWINALGQMVQSLLRKGAFDLAPLSSRGYYSHFVYIRKYKQEVGISSSESYWTLLVSGLLQPGNELQALSLGSLFLS